MVLCWVEEPQSFLKTGDEAPIELDIGDPAVSLAEQVIEMNHFFVTDDPACKLQFAVTISHDSDPFFNPIA